MKTHFNEIRIAGLSLYALIITLFLMGCDDTLVSPNPVFPVVETPTGTFEIEDNCVRGIYLLTIAKAPEQINKLIISNFRNDPNVRIKADVEGSDFIIPQQSMNLDGIIFNISGMATKTG